MKRVRVLLGFIMLTADLAGGRRAAAGNLEADAHDFMASYARDLRAHDREAIIARYDGRGAFILGNGHKRFMPMDSLAAVYRSRWQGPEFFEFTNLSFEVVGPDAVLVVGQLRWKSAARTDTTLMAYTGLLTRRKGRLRIRLEHE